MKIYKLSSLLVCICVLVTTKSVVAADAYMAPLASKSLMLDIARVSDEKLIAVGERGHILTSVNGLDWQQQAVPTTATLTAVYFLDEQHGWAVGHDATILATTDGGISWTIQWQNPELEKPLMDVHFFNLKQGIAIGAYGLFYRTEDGGQNWTRELHAEFLSEDDQAYLEDLKKEDVSLYKQELSSILPHLNHLSDNQGNTLYLVGEAGLIAFSEDEGKSWQRLDINYYGSFFAVHQQASGAIFAAGLRGNVYRIEDGNPVHLKSLINSSINDIVELDNNQLVMVGNNGRYLNVSGDSITAGQTAEGKAIVGAVWFKGQIVTATEAGLQILNIK
ncbi:WD40/YVTN/BNR-like repeat-containing protein [Neptunicella marina]|uniref:Photosynthesis system II assembly factor Ycf48/Hcf136-like domain-containing protein n=1 Tax=Neptunicella marina TaxID=2125989 RepID=A0A8J6IYD2_9ALTE|nr:YCF48-related protein [Neptunicella marina]MBC3767502.1 hypothetical protein [Neptunicella marina]